MKLWSLPVDQWAARLIVTIPIVDSRLKLSLRSRKVKMGYKHAVKTGSLNKATGFYFHHVPQPLQFPYFHARFSE